MGLTLPQVAMLACSAVVLVAAFMVLLAWHVLRDRRERAALEESANRLKAASEPVEGPGDAELAKQEVQHWKTLYLEECRKREEQFKMIEGIQRERDGWKDIFWQCSGEHGVAQEYMVRVNQHLAKLLKGNPDAKMAAIRKAFEEKYGEEGKLKIAERISDGAAGEATEVTAAVSGEKASAGAVVVAKPGPNA